MLLDQRPVSRKTPLDGKLEISPAAASRLAALGAEFPISTGARAATARLESRPCTCAKGSSGSHVHHFIESPLLRALAPGAEVRLELDEAQSVVRIEPA